MDVEMSERQFQGLSMSFAVTAFTLSLRMLEVFMRLCEEDTRRLTPK